METTARRPTRNEVENLRQPVAIVHLWWLVLGIFTLLIVLVPGLRVTFSHEALSFTLETFNALVATMVSFVALARYVFEGRVLDLAIAAAFGTIAVSSLWFGLILPFSGYTFRTAADGPLWGWVLTRLVAGVLLLLGLHGAERGQRRVARAGGRLGFIVLVVLLVDVALWHWSASLPTLLDAKAWRDFAIPGRITTSVLAGQTPLGIAIESLIAVLYFWLAYRLTMAVRHGEDAWLALAIIVAAVAQFQFIFFPAPFHPAITTSDLLWLIAYMLLLAHLGHQYIRASRGMRRQQTRTHALLALSQTPVITRDPSLVLQAASEAASVVHQEATVTVNVDASIASDPATNGGPLSVPIALDGVCYGALAVEPVGGGALEPDTEEYLRVVANQTASLLRSIELYAELARGAIRDERAQLARELHDGLAQDLAVLRLQLSGDDEESRQHHLADRALSEARYAITILRGQTAAPEDFLEELRRQAGELSDRFGLPVVIEHEESISGISGVAQVALLRICREAITNAGKHANATRVVVSVRQLHHAVEVEISDDGVGFDPALPIEPGRYGLKGMTERATLRGGTLSVQSGPGDGTTVRVRLPNTEEVADQ